MILQRNLSKHVLNTLKRSRNRLYNNFIRYCYIIWYENLMVIKFYSLPLEKKLTSFNLWKSSFVFDVVVIARFPCMAIQVTDLNFTILPAIINQIPCKIFVP